MRVIKIIPSKNICFEESIAEAGNVASKNEGGIINVYMMLHARKS